MPPPGDAGQHGPPVGNELKFEELLIAESFSLDNYRSYPLGVCASWLRLREYDVLIWIRNFRQHRSELHKTLTDIRSNLEDMFTKLDRVGGGPRSYLAVASPVEIPDRIENLFKEFLDIHDEIGDVLEQYIPYAHAYEIKNANGQILDTRRLARQPADMRKDFLEKLDLTQERIGESG